MKRKFWIVSIISIICIFFTNGCSIMTQMTSVADATSSYEDKDLLVPHNLQNMANWSSYEIWVNENISRGLLDPSSVNDKSVH
ncbi:MAG: hypothetical protein KKG93_10990, partial [Bacteroidetes bacterium]|nr:hypothetical protein [Bacteroidota bacterium]